MKINPAIREKIKKKVIGEIKRLEKKKALLITPYILDTEEYAKFIDALPFLQEKEVEKIQDKTIIAGFIVKWDSKILDASFATRVNTLATHIRALY